MPHQPLHVPVPRRPPPVRGAQPRERAIDIFGTNNYNSIGKCPRQIKNIIEPMLRSNLTMTVLIMAFLCLVIGSATLLISFEIYKPAAAVDVPKAEKPEPAGPAVYIEAGHGRGDDGVWDPGCSYTSGGRTYTEAELMVPICQSMAKYLQESGVTVYTDADEDNDLNLEDTLDFLDAHREIKAFVNVHCDWEGAGSGTMPLYKTEEQRQLAEALNDGVHEYVNIPDLGLTLREDMKTLNNERVHCPACLFETGGISADLETLVLDYDNYGKGLAAGMCRFLDVPFLGKETKQTDGEKEGEAEDENNGQD